MNKPTEGQIKKFWEWCGFKIQIDKVIDASGHEVCIKSSWFDGKQVALPDIDLNNLFKYAVPKLKEEYRNWKSVLHDWIDDCTGSDETDAILLFHKIGEHLEVIKDE